MVTVTQLAEREIRQVVTRPDNQGKFIRIRVTTGGCAGYNYDVVLDNASAPDDETIIGDGYRVVYDPFTRVLIE